MLRPHAPAQALRLLKRQAGALLAYLLAALALLGGAAFQMRNGGSLGPQLYVVWQVGWQVGTAPANTAAKAAAAQSYCGLTRWPNLQPPAAHGHGHGKAPHSKERGAHDHGAHCPFCVTQAFASGVPVLHLPSAALDALPAPARTHALHWPTPLHRANARAPPSVG